MIKLIRERPQGGKHPVIAHVKGHSDTHVLFDLVIGKEVTRNMSRPIVPFMEDYGLAD